MLGRKKIHEQNGHGWQKYIGFRRKKKLARRKLAFPDTRQINICLSGVKFTIY
jgi:hypothetical protein